MARRLTRFSVTGRAARAIGRPERSGSGRGPTGSQKPCARARTDGHAHQCPRRRAAVETRRTGVRAPCTALPPARRADHEPVRGRLRFLCGLPRTGVRPGNAGGRPRLRDANAVGPRPPGRLQERPDDGGRGHLQTRFGGRRTGRLLRGPVVLLRRGRRRLLRLRVRRRLRSAVRRRGRVLRRRRRLVVATARVRGRLAAVRVAAGRVGANAGRADPATDAVPTAAATTAAAAAVDPVAARPRGTRGGRRSAPPTTAVPAARPPADSPTLLQ